MLSLIVLALGAISCLVIIQKAKFQDSAAKDSIRFRCGIVLLITVFATIIINRGYSRKPNPTTTSPPTLRGTVLESGAKDESTCWALIQLDTGNKPNPESVIWFEGASEVCRMRRMDRVEAKDTAHCRILNRGGAPWAYSCGFVLIHSNFNL